MWVCFFGVRIGGRIFSFQEVWGVYLVMVVFLGGGSLSVDIDLRQLWENQRQVDSEGGSFLVFSGFLVLFVVGRIWDRGF